jgi:hypothetical protein
MPRSWPRVTSAARRTGVSGGMKGGGAERSGGGVGKVSSVSEQKRRTGSEVPVLGVRICDSIEAWILNPSCPKSNRVILVSKPKRAKKWAARRRPGPRRTALPRRKLIRTDPRRCSGACGFSQLSEVALRLRLVVVHPSLKFDCHQGENSRDGTSAGWILVLFELLGERN